MFYFQPRILSRLAYMFRASLLCFQNKKNFRIQTIIWFAILWLRSFEFLSLCISSGLLAVFIWIPFAFSSGDFEFLVIKHHFEKLVSLNDALLNLHQFREFISLFDLQEELYCQA